MNRLLRIQWYIPAEADDAAAQQLGFFMFEEDASFSPGLYQCAIGALIDQGEFSPVVLDVGVGAGNAAVANNHIVVSLSSKGGTGAVFIQYQGQILILQFQTAPYGHDFL